MHFLNGGEPFLPTVGSVYFANYRLSVITGSNNQSCLG